MTSSIDAPAASSTVSMLLKVCSVCSTRSSLTTLPVFGSKPPWPDRKIHSPTVSPGEYGPGGAGTLSELISAFIDGPSLEWVARAVYIPIGILTPDMTKRPNAHDALLGATSELTYESGITNTGVDAIAARAGVTKRTLYQHFGSKDRLVAEALSGRSRRALLGLETNARRRAEETGELAILVLFDVIENALHTT